jgi:hypothetical protein
MHRKTRHVCALVGLAVALPSCTFSDPDPVDRAAEDEPGAIERSSSAVHLARQCDTLAATLSSPGTVFVSSRTVPAGELTLAGSAVPAHCLLVGKLDERTSPVDGQTYAIGFEIRLPLAWNRRFFYQANGGIDGNVVPATGNTSGGGPLTSALLQGFAVISSDAGHNAAQNPTFGIDPQARLDYGYQAVGKLTPMAKAVIRAAYGRSPAFSYIGGCSNGGRHTMVAAARYADEYDGFLVGSPGFNLPKAAVASIYGAQQYAPLAVPGATIPGGPFAGLPDLSGAYTTEERQLVSSAVLAKCDRLDGVADGMVQDVVACERAFDLAADVPTCTGPRNGTCLTAAQKTAIANAFAGPNDALGRPLYTRFPFDTGHGTADVVFWDFISPLVLDAGAVGFIFKTPPANPATFIPPLFALTANIQDLATEIFATSATYRQSGMELMTPPNPERLTTLRRRGGRMLVYHGVSDPIFSVNDTIAWFRGLDGNGGRDRGHGDDAARFAQLFLVPGMNHCAGGPSTDQFDLLGPLVHWVEDGRAPEQVIAHARGAGNPGGVNPDVPAAWAADRTRPLCPFPRVATYRGGSVDQATSFACR